MDTKEPYSANSQDRVFYGGTTKEEIMDKSNHRIGLQHWAKEGIAGKSLIPIPYCLMTQSSKHTSPQLIRPTGRGIFLDYVLWASLQSPPITYSTFSTHYIPFSAILSMLTHFAIKPQRGDILFIRTGVMPEWDSFTDEKKREYAAQKEPQHAGVEASVELLEWLWDAGVASVVGDAISWEVSLRLSIL